MPKHKEVPDTPDKRIVQLNAHPRCYVVSSSLLNELGVWSARYAALYYKYGTDWREGEGRENWLKVMARKILDLRKYSRRAADALFEDLLAKEKPAFAEYLRQQVALQENLAG